MLVTKMYPTTHAAQAKTMYPKRFIERSQNIGSQMEVKTVAVGMVPGLPDCMFVCRCGCGSSTLCDEGCI